MYTLIIYVSYTTYELQYKRRIEITRLLAAQATSVPGNEFIAKVCPPAHYAPHPPSDRNPTLMGHQQHPVQARALFFFVFLWVRGACMHYNSTRRHTCM